jgi:phenylalanyl-tRNA synthetase beta chain
MKFSENWLREWIITPAPVTEWAAKLTAAGLEVEEMTSVGTQLEQVCVAEVLTVLSHPDSTRLHVCTVGIVENDAAPLTIVCGASNVRPGLKIALAQVGAVLPGDKEIGQSSIRGVSSSGMICSSAELGLGESTTPGIMELPLDAPVGMPICTYLGLPDHVLDLGITPNRGDCLSVLGLARELCGAADWPMQQPSTPRISSTDLALPVEVEANIACPRYTGRMVRNIRSDATTPIWMQTRLQRSQIRCIHPIVDIMNYVMLELGQPLHAFDLAAIAQKIVVRESHKGEQVALLNGQILTLEKPALVIADAHKILALAGIMGGENSGVTAATTDIFIESAFFAPDAIRPTLRTFSLQSDAAHRFERGVDPELPLRALARATELVLQIAGGEAGSVVEVSHAEHLSTAKQILLRADRITRILGITLSQETVEDLLRRLYFQYEKEAAGWNITVPSHRFDIEEEIDLIEEIARLYGYTEIPSHTLKAPLVMHPVPETTLSLSTIRRYFADSGYHEAINYSFVDPALASLLNPDHLPLTIRNPISADMSVMRASLWPGLIQSALFNLRRQQPSVRFFETGVCFFPEGEEVAHIPHIAGIMIGSASGMQWNLQKKEVDFFDIKGDLENLFALAKVQDMTYLAGAHPALHPGICAQIQRAGKEIGWVGALHPKLQDILGISLPVYLFELHLTELLPTALPIYSAPSKYPSIRRDLAFILDASISYQEVHKAIQSYASTTLQQVQLFDIYTGAGIPAHQKSMALSLTFQRVERTLTDEEIDAAVEQVVSGLKTHFGAELRAV